MLRERKTLPGVKHQEVREYETRHRQRGRGASGE